MNQPRAGLATSIYHHVVAYLRNPGNDTERLRLVFSALNLNWDTWSIDPDKVLLEEALANNNSFRRDLGKALDWDVPERDRPALVQKAIGSADVGWNTAELKKALPPDLNWDESVKKMDQEKIKNLLYVNPSARKAVARALGYSPGKNEAGDLADAAIQNLEANEDVAKIAQAFQKHTLNWNEFLEGRRETEFKERIREDLEFRQSVAAATGYVSEEAFNLASLAVQMLRNMHHDLDAAAIQNTIKNISIYFRNPEILNEFISVAPSPQEALKALIKGSRPIPRDPGTLVEEIAREFSQDPGIAAKLWEKMGWPRPFSLVLREEQRQIGWRRRTAEASDLAQRTVAILEALPLKPPKPNGKDLSSTIDEITDFLRKRDPKGHQSLVSALEEFKNA